MVVSAPVRLAPFAFVRPGELRQARWADVNMDAAEWRYAASKTKTPHIAPLASQALEILREHRSRGVVSTCFQVFAIPVARRAKTRSTQLCVRWVPLGNDQWSRLP